MVDAVITYVDSTDITWQNEYNKFVKRPLSECLNRFRAYGVLDLQIKLIRKFMPFVDKVFVIVSSMSQVPDMVKCMDGVRIVLHKEIIPKMFLPCFNSCTIEMFFQNITSLSEQFLYFNDDIFPVHACKECDFFSDGKVRVNYRLCTYDEDNATIFQKNVMNSTSLFYKKNEILYNGIKPEHSVLPMLKSACKETFDSNNDKILKSLSRTRHSKNINVYAPMIYLFKANKRKMSFLCTKYFYADNVDFGQLSSELDDAMHFICINDNDLYNDFDRFKIELRVFLECLLEDKPYEASKIEELISKEHAESIQEATNEVQAISNDHQLKVALCAIAKNENLYIREWVKWYKNLGISKIFLYDNNEFDGERFEEVINDYIESGFVEVIDRRGITKTVKSDKDGQTLQGLCYSNCYYGHCSEYDWMCFFDIDEFLEIYDKYDGLFDFLFDFSEFDGIRVQWKMFGDNNQLYYENKPVMKRFKKESNSSYDRHVKQIINCHKKFNEELMFCAHGVFNKKYNFVNLKKEKLKNVYMDIVYHDDLPVYLNHFYCKSTEEFFKRKYNKTSAVTGINTNRNFNIDFLKNQYFEHNERTEEKERFIDIFINSNNSVNVYMASLYKDGHVIESIKSILRQPQVKTLTLSANNYTDEQYNNLLVSIDSSKLVVHRTNNEKLSFEKLRFVNEDRSTKYVAFCDDDLIFYDGYFIKMISECELLDAVVSYHGGILKKLPINHYYPDRKSFSFNREVKENKNVDIIGNGVSLFKRDWITYEQWKILYENAPEVSMDDITVSYTLRKNGYRLIVVKHSIGDVTERKNNSDTVYNIYKKNDSVQTDWVNKYFVNL